MSISVLYVAVWLFILVLFIFVCARSLLLSLLLIELSGFTLLYVLVVSSPAMVASSEALVLVIFSLFVIEGVIGLSGLILLVSSSGSDYVSSSTFLNL